MLFIWVWNFVCFCEGIAETEGVWEFDADENIWTQEREVISGVEITA
jgi:hypothetical protein